MKKTIIAVSIIFTVSSITSFAGTIFGSVKDEKGKPVPGAEVKIYGKDIKTKSDEKGKFKIVNEKLADGNRYSVKVNAKGYDTGQTLSTEVFDDPEEMEALEVVMYKEKPIPEPTPAPTGIVQNIERQTDGIITITEEVVEENEGTLIPEKKEKVKPIIAPEKKKTPTVEKKEAAPAAK